MDSLDSFTHPQAIAAAFAVVDLSIAWAIALVGLTTLLARHRQEASPEPAVQERPVIRKRRFA